MSLSHGRDMFSTPGPSVIPDRVLRAMHRAAPNIYEGELVEVTGTVINDLKRLAGTSGEVAIYIGNGHAAWEASVANLLAPGDRVLVLATGPFGHGWADTARRLGAEVDLLDFGFRTPVDVERLRAALSADTNHSYRAVFTVQTDTGSSAKNDIEAIRTTIDEVGHPALLGVDSIASFACEPMHMDAWGVDVLLAACQKGLMVPPGVAFTFHGSKADRARVECPSPYWDWEPRVNPKVFYQLFCGTPPTHHLYGLREALDMIVAEEGVENVWRRHQAMAEAVWAALEVWSAKGAVTPNVESRLDRSTAVTTIRTEPEVATRLRDWCTEHTGLTLGVGLVTPDQDRDAVFRIGHMGHLNPHMILGTLASIESGLEAIGVPRGSGAVEQASRVLARYSA